MDTLSKVQFGSTLYGTTVPDSDLDYRSIYLPAINDCLLIRANQAWDDETEEDTSVFSLQRFLAMAEEGQSIAIELLSAPDSAVVATSEVWSYLRSQRRRFFTKSMDSFLHFSKAMASKYSRRVDRLNEVEAVLTTLGAGDPTLLNVQAFHRLGTIWDQLPESTNAQKGLSERASGDDKRTYTVCGRELQATVTIGHAYSVVKRVYDGFGERVRIAQEGKIEWKSLGHAFRTALQCREIVETGDLRFPLKDREWLRSVRLGQVDFVQHSLDRQLDDLIAEVQGKMDASDLPQSVDQDWLDSIVLWAYGRAGHPDRLLNWKT